MALYFLLGLSSLVFVPVIGARLLLTLFALNLGAKPLTVGLLAATFSIFPMLLAVPVGKLADRFGSRWLVFWGTVGGACGMLVPYLMPGMIALFVAAAMNGIAFALYAVSLQNDVGLLSEPHTRAQNFSNFSLVGSAVTLVGPLLVGYSVDHVGHALTCLYTASISLIPIVLLVIWGGMLPRSRHSGVESTDSIFKTLSDSSIWKLLATSSLSMAGMDFFQFYIPIYGHGIGLSASAIGIVLGAFAAAGFIVRLILKHLIIRFKEETVLIWSFNLGALSFLVIPFFENGIVLAVLAFVFGLSFGCTNPIITLLMFSRSAPGRSGETLGLRMTFNHLTRAVGPVVFGSLGSAFGLIFVFWVNALMLATGGLLSRTKR